LLGETKFLDPPCALVVEKKNAAPDPPCALLVERKKPRKFCPPFPGTAPPQDPSFRPYDTIEVPAAVLPESIYGLVEGKGLFQ
jgi:hypothetical protein